MLLAGWATFADRIALWFLSFYPQHREISLGDWGDSFGAINVLFSAVAMLVLVVTLWAQWEAIDGQQKAIETQRKDAHLQRFESSFYQLLGLMRELRDGITYNSSSSMRHSDATGYAAMSDAATSMLAGRESFGDHPNIAKGIDGMNAAYRQVVKFHRSLNAASSSTKSERSYDENINNLVRAYRDQVFRKNEVEFGAYFRVVYYIIRKVMDDGVLDSDEKLYYYRLIRGQLTSVESTMIGINCLTKESKDMIILVRESRICKYCKDDYIRPILAFKIGDKYLSGRRDPLDEI